MITAAGSSVFSKRRTFSAALAALIRLGAILPAVAGCSGQRGRQECYEDMINVLNQYVGVLKKVKSSADVASAIEEMKPLIEKYDRIASEVRKQPKMSEELRSELMPVFRKGTQANNEIDAQLARIGRDVGPDAVTKLRKHVRKM